MCGWPVLQVMYTSPVADMLVATTQSSTNNGMQPFDMVLVLHCKHPVAAIHAGALGSQAGYSGHDHTLSASPAPLNPPGVQFVEYTVETTN